MVLFRTVQSHPPGSDSGHPFRWLPKTDKKEEKMKQETGYKTALQSLPL